MPIFTNFRTGWYPDQPVSGQSAHLGFALVDASIRAPVYQDERQELSLSANIRSEFFSTNAIFPDSHQAFPDELWNIHLGTMYRYRFDNGWIAGGGLSVGSASDKPFNNLNETTLGFNSFLRIPWGERDAWLLSLSYANNSQLPIPIPGVAYLWQPTDYFRANLGLPFQIWYRPIDDLTLDFSYMLLTNVHARATYRLAPAWRLYAGYDWYNEGYFPSERSDTNTRLYYYEMRLSSGVQYNITPQAQLDLSAGYAFDRFYYEGQNLGNQSNNRIDVGDGAFLSLHVQVRW